MQDAKLFLTRLTFSSTTSILFAFSSAWLTLPSLFSLFLCFFFPPGPRNPGWEAYLEGSTPPYFPCEAWNSGLHGKTPYPFFHSLPFAFPETFALSRTFPHFSHFHA
jgi:hypothetical protein